MAEEAIENNNKTGTARKYGLDPKQVREWITDLEKLRAIPGRKSRFVRKIKPCIGRYQQLEAVSACTRLRDMCRRSKYSSTPSAPKGAR